MNFNGLFHLPPRFETKVQNAQYGLCGTVRDNTSRKPPSGRLSPSPRSEPTATQAPRYRPSMPRSRPAHAARPTANAAAQRCSSHIRTRTKYQDMLDFLLQRLRKPSPPQTEFSDPGGTGACGVLLPGNACNPYDRLAGLCRRLRTPARLKTDGRPAPGQDGCGRDKSRPRFTEDRLRRDTGAGTAEASRTACGLSPLPA